MRIKFIQYVSMSVCQYVSYLVAGVVMERFKYIEGVG